MDIRLVLVTFPDFEDAREIGTRMVNLQLAACVNLIPAVNSIYRWEGEVREESEVLAIFKTTADAFPALEAALVAAHHYDVPEVVSLTPDSVHGAYANWLASSVYLSSENLTEK